MEACLIELFLEKVIHELGATGMLVVGLYLFLGRPLKTISGTLTKIDTQLCAIVRIKERV